ncbi:MAG: hypothetical protein K2I81_00685 [Alphaproteobacteria bacterium]|nr:hypothetical protein [Alphaproteobacteria bacterium]
MTKNKQIADDIPLIPEIPEIPQSEYPPQLISKLCTFYNKYPNYKTGIVDISILARLAAQELEKFTRRPHKQVIQICFDDEPTPGYRV